MLKLTDVTLTYPDGDSSVTALDHVSLAVEPGDFVAITGPSGSGKSSLLAVASTLQSADSGGVEVAGQDVVAMGRKQRARLRAHQLGIVFQAPNLLPALKVREQLEIIARIGGGDLANMSAAERRAHIDTILDEVGVGALASRRPGQLSGGQRQRINIARAIVHNPRVMLVDEPTSALDRSRGRQVIELLQRVTKRHSLATVVVTHDPEQLPSFDRVYEMRDGLLGVASPALAS